MRLVDIINGVDERFVVKETTKGSRNIKQEIDKINKEIDKIPLKNGEPDHNNPKYKRLSNLRAKLYDLYHSNESVLREEDVDEGLLQQKAEELKQLSSKEISKALDRISDEVGGYGVEVIRDHSQWDNYFGDIVAEYINMGDTYVPTIIYDVVKDEVLVTNFGDFVEKTGYGMDERMMTKGEFKKMTETTINELTGNYFKITTPFWTDDAKMFIKVVNQGIDSHLQGFTRSKFDRKGDRLVMNFHNSELPILLRRLRELGDTDADQWADDIENHEDVDEGCKNKDDMNEGWENVGIAQLKRAINDLKTKLMVKWRKSGAYENFGEKEGRMLRDKFNYNPYGDSIERKMAKMIDEFENWAMNYTGDGIQEENVTGNLDGGLGQPKIPHAFQRNKPTRKDKQKEYQNATSSTGYGVAPKTNKYIKKVNEIYKRIEERLSNIPLTEADYDITFKKNFKKDGKRVVVVYFLSKEAKDVARELNMGINGTLVLPMEYFNLVDNLFKEKGLSTTSIDHQFGEIKEIKYTDYKADETTSPKAKINKTIQEVNRKLFEIEHVLNHAIKLRKESGLDQGVFWKSTFKRFGKISERMLRIGNKLREFNK